MKRLPDEPRWLEARAMLAEDGHEVWVDPTDKGAFVVVSGSVPLGCVVGRPAAEVVNEALDTVGDIDLMVPLMAEEADAAHVLAGLPGWEAIGATQHAWPNTEAPRALETDTECRWLLPEDLRGADIDEDLLVELTEALGRSRVAAALDAQGTLVAFCYAYQHTETLWAVSVDTLASHRRQGFGSAVFRWLGEQLASDGLLPVWGAADDNPASAAMARKLGFVESARLAVLTPAGGKPVLG